MTRMRCESLYGGSVTADNAAELLHANDVDGALVGGASLTAAKFLPIMAAVHQSKLAEISGSPPTIKTCDGWLKVLDQ